MGQSMKIDKTSEIEQILCRSSESGSMDLGTIAFDCIGIGHNSIWDCWNKAQFNLMVLE